MLGSKLSKSEMIKDIKRLEKNIRQRAENISKREDLPQFGVESFRNFETRLKNKLGDKRNLSSLSDKDIITIHRDVRYLNKLKSLNIKGAEKARDIYVPFKERISTLSPQSQDRVYEIYDKVLDRLETMEDFKYELYDYIVDYIYEGEFDNDKAVLKIFEKYDDTLKKLGRKATDGDIAVLFTSKLKDNRK